MSVYPNIRVVYVAPQPQGPHMNTLHAASARPSDLRGASTDNHRAPGNGRPLAALLLAAAVAALAVAADRLMASWADEQLLATWIALWAVVFAGSLLLAGTARRTAQRVTGALDTWARRRADARAEARAWVLARRDPRLMAELQAARDHAEACAPVTAVPKTVATPDSRATVEWAWTGSEVIELGGYRRVVPYYI